MGSVPNYDSTETGSVAATSSQTGGRNRGSRESQFHSMGGTLLTRPSAKLEFGQRKDRQKPECKRSPIESFLMAVRSRESCSQRTEPYG